MAAAPGASVAAVVAAVAAALEELPLAVASGPSAAPQEKRDNDWWMIDSKNIDLDSNIDLNSKNIDLNLRNIEFELD